ncbi:MAG: matrixin family metalloprotease [Thermoguttaceae bacterium]
MNRIGMTIVCWALLGLAARLGCAGVVVLQNGTPLKIEYVLRLADGRQSRQIITPTDVASFPTTEPVTVILGEGPATHSYQLTVNSVNYIMPRNGIPEVVHLALPGSDGKAQASAQPPAQAAPPGQTPPADEVYKIPVAILTDSADPHTQAVWEKRVRKRLAEASDIFEHHCRVRFEVVTVGHWVSDPATRSFDQSLMEFAQKVRPAPARLAIGFTTHYEWVRGEMHLGGTHGALATHVLIRESPGQVSEPERLEVLVHELGHFLGAAHTADKTSVMRPMLGDRQSAAKAFRIGFDAPNTLIMCLIAEEMRTRHLWHPSVLSPEAKNAVRGAYMALAQTIPQDPVSTSSIQSLGPPPQTTPAGSPSPEVINGARYVLQAVVRAARENQQLPVSSKNPRATVWRTSDELTTYYVRRAAAAARQLPPRAGPSAFLLGLGVALDDSNFVRDKPALNEVWQKIEADDQRPARLLLLGTPTMFKRHNVTRHFTISSALVVLSGPQGAEAVGLGREILDSRGGDGFSFADLCADMAGVMFATHVREEDIPLADIAARFQIEDYVPKMEGLPDDLTWDSFVKQYGEPGSENFQRQRADLFHRILALPAYRAPEATKKKG